MILARDAGSEEFLDEMAVTGRIRLLPPGLHGASGALAVLEAVADLRRSVTTGPDSGGASILGLPQWRTSLDAAARLLARQYGGGLVPASRASAPPWPRVLLVDLTGSQHDTVGRLTRWVVEIGGEAVVVTAGGAPPCADVVGAVTVDLRREQQTLTHPPLRGIRRRLPALARPALDVLIGAYQSVRLRPHSSGPRSQGRLPRGPASGRTWTRPRPRTLPAPNWQGGGSARPRCHRSSLKPSSANSSRPEHDQEKRRLGESRQHRRRASAIREARTHRGSAHHAGHDHVIVHTGQQIDRLWDALLQADLRRPARRAPRSRSRAAMASRRHDAGQRWTAFPMLSAQTG